AAASERNAVGCVRFDPARPHRLGRVAEHRAAVEFLGVAVEGPQLHGRFRKKLSRHDEPGNGWRWQRRDSRSLIPACSRRRDAYCTLPKPSSLRGSLAASSLLLRRSQITTFMK